MPKLFGPLAERFKDRKGGYTRIHKMGNRFGDNAPVAVIELIDGPGDLKNQLLFKALARQEKAQPGSIANLVEQNKEKMTLTSTFKNKALARQIPKVLSSNKWELADLEEKVRQLSLAGDKESPKIFDATNTKA